MQVEVIAKVINVREWMNDENQSLVTFESLEPFHNAGCNKVQLANKTYRSESKTTLYVNKDFEDIIGCGWALFLVTTQTYPRIQFKRMSNNNEFVEQLLMTRLANLEKIVAELGTLVQQTLTVVNKIAAKLEIDDSDTE